MLNHISQSGATSNRLQAVATGASDEAFEYSGNGAMIARSRRTQDGAFNSHTLEAYSWDPFGLIKRYERRSETVTSPATEFCAADATSSPADIWTYRFSPWQEREQKRQVASSTASDDGLAWVYYLQGQDKSVLATYHGLESATCDSTRQVYLWPAERMVYGAGGVRLIHDVAGGLQYVVTDHLGSTRAMFNQAGQVLSTTDYRPFGSPLTSAGITSRTTYIDRERDAETSLGSYGVRLYDAELGRFTSVDPLWGLYEGLQPYQYAGNSPVMALDWNGKWIEAVTEAAQSAVRNSVPSCFRDAVTFNQDGILNAGPLVVAANGQDSESNIANLAGLATHADGIEVMVDEQVNYKDAKGALRSVPFDVIEKQNGGTRAWLGQTLPVGSDKGKIGTNEIPLFSTGENIQVVVRKDPPNTSSTIGSTAAHELIGHARLIILCREGKAKSAIHGDSTVEKAIKRAEREAKE